MTIARNARIIWISTLCRLELHQANANATYLEFARSLPKHTTAFTATRSVNSA
jgi:hypothetical protein